MITPKIKALFQFIEYLYSNIENFNQYKSLIKELETLNNVRSNLKPEQNYKDKLQYNKVQTEIESKFKTLQDNTANLIKAKAKELNICNFNNEPNYSFNGIETEIRQLKKNFTDKNLPEIFKYKSQYLKYRSQTHGTFLSLQFFFDELDELAKSLFDYFKDTQQNEFEAFETKAIQVNYLSEAFELLSIGKNKFSFPINSKQPRNKPQFTTHEKLFEAVIFSANEEQNKPISGAYELLKEVWFFLNSDSATFNGKEVEKYKRPLFVNPVIVGEPEFDKFFEAEIIYCSTQNKICLKEQDFITDISNWIEKKSEYKSLSISRQRKYKEFLAYLDSKLLQLKHTQESTAQPHREEKPKYFTKHYVLAYLFDCDANKESYPIGNKKELERIGNERIGYGKGNTFYKNFNDIINDPNFNIKNEAYLIDLIGENWLNIVTELSKNPELVKKHIEETNIK